MSTSFNTTNNLGVQPNMYASNYDYDANGNLTNLTRHNQQGEQIDNIVYQYDPEKKHNRLLEVDDVGYNPNTGSYDAPGNPEGLKNDSEYTYDKIGNLKTDDGEKIDNIEWTVYGKVKSVEKEGGATTSYRYDAAGNRILKTVVGNGTTTHTHYLRDASGNIMATYKTLENEGENNLLEHPLYGSSRLGIYNGGTNEGYRTLANKQYELSNHLGNVLTTITDKKVGIDSDNDQVANHYIADISSISDYYPFGLAMKERSMSEDGYRFGFNGMERDENIADDNYDFGTRIYNPAIGQFLTLDPLMKKYPNLSAYVFTNDNPILYKDIDGKDWIYYDESGKELNRTKSKWYHFHWLTGDKKITLSNKDLKRGGFFAYVNFKGLGDLHSSIVDVKTGDLYEARHPDIDGVPVNGSEFKDEGKLFYEANSKIAKFEGDDKYEFANKEWWTYKVQNLNETESDKSPNEVGVSYIWIPNRAAMLDFLNKKVGEKVDWTPVNNCKTFCRDAMMEGFEGVFDEVHTEIRDLLKNETVHPGSMYNEFGENKVVKNPEKERIGRNDGRRGSLRGNKRM